MPLTNTQLQERVEAIEEIINNMQTAMNNLTSKQQMKALLNIRQTEINTLTERVETLESQVNALLA